MTTGGKKTMNNIYVGNLEFTATADQVRGVFQPHGTVETVTLVRIVTLAIHGALHLLK
jgi:RNA recognition motif-containing protein